jgi:hypothetical protein
MKPYSTFISLLVFLLFASCSNPEGSGLIELVEQSIEEESKFAISGIKNIVIENSRGGVITYGSGINDTILYTLSKTVKAESKELAQSHFDKIQLETILIIDTLYCSVIYPFNDDNLESYGYLDIYIPREIPITLQNMVEGVYVSYMSGAIRVRDVKDHISIAGHNGSCDVHTNKGRIRIEIALPDSSHCKAGTEYGDILLTIPDQTSATISARTDFGNIIYTGLNIENLTQSYGLLTGIIGNGIGEIILETKNGNIYIIGI